MIPESKINRNSIWVTADNRTLTPATMTTCHLHNALHFFKKKADQTVWRNISISGPYNEFNDSFLEHRKKDGFYIYEWVKCFEEELATRGDRFVVELFPVTDSALVYAI